MSKEKTVVPVGFIFTALCWADEFREFLDRLKLWTGIDYDPRNIEWTVVTDHNVFNHAAEVRAKLAELRGVKFKTRKGVK